MATIKFMTRELNVRYFINSAHIFTFCHRNSQIVFPKSEENELSLTQRYLNLQIYFFAGMSWSIELGISDQNKVIIFVILD